MWRNIKRPVARACIIAMMSVGAVAVTTPAFAGGDSNRVNNCFTRWYSSSWDQRCDGSGATSQGNYQSRVYCDQLSDQSLTAYRYRNDKTVVGSGGSKDCFHLVRTATTNYQG